jgi:hypothetical protein
MTRENLLLVLHESQQSSKWLEFWNVKAYNFHIPLPLFSKFTWLY